MGESAAFTRASWLGPRSASEPNSTRSGGGAIDDEVVNGRSSRSNCVGVGVGGGGGKESMRRCKNTILARVSKALQKVIGDGRQRLRHNKH